MSANWSIVYFEKSITDDAFFKAVQEAFALNLEGKLYGVEYDDNRKLVSFRLGDSITEQFNGDAKRARLVQDGLINALYGHGILHYPQRNNLHVIADSIIRLDVLLSGRMRRDELKHKLKTKPDPSSEIIFCMMDFLRQLTQALKCHAVHIMFERNPAGQVTSVHLYDSGELVDDYYYENLEAVSTQLIEYPLTSQFKTLLNGRFSFLTELPFIYCSPNDDDNYVQYFEGEDLPLNRRSDHFGLNSTDLYVPFWEDDTLPIGAIYCLEKPFPDYFLERYDK